MYAYTRTKMFCSLLLMLLLSGLLLCEHLVRLDPLGSTLVVGVDFVPHFILLQVNCVAMSSFARRLCTVFLSPDLLSPFLVCRLIALDKNPGVRPIGVCEVMRRIVAKAVLVILRDDIQEAAGSHQLCAGQLSGAEAAVHAVRKVFEEGSTEAVLLVDASNAFNSLNRLVALHNIR